MAYTPIGNKAKSGGYVPIGNKAQPKPKPDLQESFPTLNRVREITTAPRYKAPVTSASNMSKAVADKQRDVTISQGTEKISPLRKLVRAIPGDSRFEKSLERDVIDPIARVGRAVFPSAGDTMRQIVNEKPGLTNEQLQEETRKRIAQGGISLNAPGTPIVSDTPIFSPDIIGMIKKVPAKLVQRFVGTQTTDDAVRLAREIGVTAPSPKFLDDIVKANDEAQVQKIVDDLKTNGVVKEQDLPPLPRASVPVATKVDNVATAPARIEPKAPVAQSTPDPKNFKTADEFVAAHGETTYRGASVKEWEDVKNTGSFSDREGTTLIDKSTGKPIKYDDAGKNTTTSKELADGYAKNSSNEGVTIEFKPEAKAKMRFSAKFDSSDLQADEFLGEGLDINDVARVTDKNGKVIYESSDLSKTKSQLTDIWNKAQGNDLLAEAKKYKSAEEFIKAQGTPVYHGTSAENAKGILNNGFVLGKGKGVSGTASNDFIYATPSKTGANKYVSGRLGIKEPTVIDATISGKTLVIPGNNWDFEAFGEASKRLGVPLKPDSRGNLTMLDMPAIKSAMEEQGFGSIIFKDRGANGSQAVAVLPNKIKTRTQLTDIWNQAQKTAPAIDLPPLPKLPPEMAQKLRVQQADETISRAVFDRYKNVANKPPVVDSKVVAEAKKAPGGQTKKFFGELLTPISSRLRRISPDLEVQMRKMEFEVNQTTAQSMSEIKPLLEGSSKMVPIDRQLFSLARLNGDREVYEALAEKYGLTNQLKAAESALEDIRGRANEVGMDIAKRENYNPRIIKNPKAYLNYWRGQDDWGDINRLIEEEAKKKNITYTDLMKDPEKVASIINNYIRGYGSKTVLAAPSATKKRTIAVLDEELAEFYEDADTALATYMIRMNDEIAGRKFFGKKADGEADIQDSIGAHVMELVAAGKIKPQQQEEVADILRARFHRGKIAGALDLYRNAEYISTMGSPVSAITQIGDFAWSLYDNGFWNTGKAIVGKKKLTRESLGLDASIMNEYTNGTLGGKAVEKTFKLVGLDKMARLGQESMVNAQFGKYQKLARENDDVIRAEMDRLFDSDEAAQAMKEFANGEITERTKFVVFNRLLDFQPLTKSEMPQVYLERPNGRIFYMLKSFTLKQYDVFRREAFDKIATGEAAQVKQGTKNLIALAGLFMVANATADEIKDLLLGRETPPSDRLVDNLWRLVGASKYDVYKAREEGIGTTVLRKILFPASIWDRASKDFETVVTDKEYEKGPLAGENYKFESTQTIPVAGKLYYWWFGRGAQKEEYKESQGTTTETGAAEPPALPELPKLPKLPKI